MLRACGYGRVSTAEEEQTNALTIQVEEIKEAIRRNGWELTDMYVDEGKSGTTTKSRGEYQRLCEDLEADKWDIIVIKSQDRLMRSARDWYLFTERLIQNKKRLFFYIENTYYTPDDTIVTGIKAILAEEYSRELSKKERNAHATRRRKAQENGIKDGIGVVLTGNTWGYKKEDKRVVIVKDEAEMVRLIFNMAANENLGSRSIAKYLLNRGYKSHTGNPVSEGVVRKIIRNPLYKTVAVMNQRTYDFNTKGYFYNDEKDIVRIPGAVPRIVSDEIWERANANMDSRSKQVRADENGKKRIGVKRGRNKYSGKVRCGYCGKPFWMKTRRVGGKNLIEWACCNYIQHGRKDRRNRGHEPIIRVEDTERNGCDNITIQDSMLDKLLRQYAEHYDADAHNAEFEYAEESITKLLTQEDDSQIRELQAKQADIETRKNALLDKLLDGIISNKTYSEAVVRYDAELFEVEKRLTEIEAKKRTFEETLERLQQIKKRLAEMRGDDGVVAENVISCIEEIVIYKDLIEIKAFTGEVTSFRYEIRSGENRRNIGGKRPNDIFFL